MRHTALSILLHGLAAACLLWFPCSEPKKESPDLGALVSAAPVRMLPQPPPAPPPVSKKIKTNPQRLPEPEPLVLTVEKSPVEPEPDPPRRSQEPVLEARETPPLRIPPNRRFDPEPPPPAETVPLPETAPDSEAAPSMAEASDATPLPGRNLPPHYPRLARIRGWEGTVTVEVRVEADGTPGEVRVVSSSGYHALDEAAVEAVRGWRFSPALRRGRPVASSCTFTFQFRLVE